MTTTKALIKAVAPELAVLDTIDYAATWDFCIDEANSRNCNSQSAQTYHAAHLLTLSLPGAGAGSGGSVSGPVKRKKSRNLEIEYADNSSSWAKAGNAEFTLTRYGLRYLSLMRSSNMSLQCY